MFCITIDFALVIQCHVYAIHIRFLGEIKEFLIKKERQKKVHAKIYTKLTFCHKGFN